jgi:F-type H+-transporting ATPase subunit b
MELISKLGIDLKLLLAQVVNFLILFFVLRALVYKPILNLLEKRKTQIEKNVEDTKKIEERLTQLEEEKTKVLSNASKEAMKIVEDARKKSSEDHEKAMANTKKEISALAERYRGQLKDEKEEMLHEIKKEVAELVVSASSKILQKEFSKDDQSRLEKAIKDELKSAK